MGDGLFLGMDVQQGVPLKLDPSRLRTHGVVVGMTGSGKTGLSLVLLEELVRQGVPIIAIDPKGDLGNLGLLFPGLAKEHFAAWSTEDDPAQLSSRWTEGLKKWGLSTADVESLSDNMDLKVYTPGSEAGIPVDVVGSFGRPPQAVLDDSEARRDLVAGTVSGLLGLVGRSSSVRDPEHVVLSQVVEQAWIAGEDLTLEALILRLVDPPFEKVGVFPLDRFFPPKDRMDLAMAFNAVVAAPSFEPWTRGAGLDMDKLLTSDGRTPVHVYNIAHLDESQRQFFVSLLLGRLKAWSRSQPGTEALRALLFFDEVAGYLPPHPKNPPSKAPLLTMMKQARAVGLGVVLATQNPVDLDYKALSNAGLWCIGRLSTPQDRERLLKGIGDSSLDEQVAGLEKRQFLIHQVGRGQPAVVQSRHAMCYLRGPFTRIEVTRLNAWLGVAAPVAAPAAAAPAAASTAAAPAAPAADPLGDLLPQAPTAGGSHWFLNPQVAFSARMEDRFSNYAEPARDDGRIVYQAALYADLSLVFDEDRVGFVKRERLRRVWFPLGAALPDDPMPVRIESDDLSSSAPQGALFKPLPDWMDESRELKALSKKVSDHVYRGESRGMWVNPALKLHGRTDESREDFDARCADAIEDRVDAGVAKLEKSFGTKLKRLEDRISAKQARLEQYESRASAKKMEEAMNIGETIFSLFSGRRRSLSSVVSKRNQSSQAAMRTKRTEDELEGLQADMEDLQHELVDRIEQLRADQEELLEKTAEKAVRLERNDIQLEAFGVLWVPVTRRI